MKDDINVGPMLSQWKGFLERNIFNQDDSEGLSQIIEAVDVLRSKSMAEMTDVERVFFLLFEDDSLDLVGNSNDGSWSIDPSIIAHVYSTRMRIAARISTKYSKDSCIVYASLGEVCPSHLSVC